MRSKLFHPVICDLICTISSEHHTVLEKRSGYDWLVKRSQEIMHKKTCTNSFWYRTCIHMHTPVNNIFTCLTVKQIPVTNTLCTVYILLYAHMSRVTIIYHLQFQSSQSSPSIRSELGFTLPETNS